MNPALGIQSEAEKVSLNWTAGSRRSYFWLKLEQMTVVTIVLLLVPFIMIYMGVRALIKLAG